MILALISKLGRHFVRATELCTLGCLVYFINERVRWTFECDAIFVLHKNHLPPFTTILPTVCKYSWLMPLFFATFLIAEAKLNVSLRLSIAVRFILTMICLLLISYTAYALYICHIPVLL